MTSRFQTGQGALRRRAIARVRAKEGLGPLKNRSTSGPVHQIVTPLDPPLARGDNGYEPGRTLPSFARNARCPINSDSAFLNRTSCPMTLKGAKGAERRRRENRNNSRVSLNEFNESKGAEMIVLARREFTTYGNARRTMINTEFQSRSPEPVKQTAHDSKTISEDERRSVFPFVTASNEPDASRVSHTEEVLSIG